MSAGEYHKVAALADLPQGKSLCIEFEAREILLCHTSEGLFAVDNMCSHAAARLCEGKLKGSKVFCPLHGAAFDVRNGAALTRPASIPLQTFELREEAGDLLLRSPD